MTPFARSVVLTVFAALLAGTAHAEPPQAK